MEGSKCGSPPSWFERNQFRTLIVQSNPSAEIWRIAGSHAAPYHFGLEVDSGPLLCNQTMGSKSAPMALRALPLQNTFFNLSRQILLARWHCLATTPSQIFALSYTFFTRLFSIRLANLFAHCNFFFWRTNCFFLSPLPNDRSL
jgi:hypothetical protein